MKTGHLLLTVLAILALGLAAGCSEQMTEPDTAIDTPTLEDEFGGYAAVNEDAGFGDDALLDEAYESDVEYDDPMLASPEMDSLIADPNSGYYHMRIVWGRLAYDSTVLDPTDWAGSLTISRGAEVIRHVIRFEPGQDEILPRTDRSLIEWNSVTTVHNDGIAVDLPIPPVRPLIDTTEVILVDTLGDTSVTLVIDTTLPDVEPVTVAFETTPYSRTFQLEELMALDTIVMLDDSNAVAFHAVRVHRMPCPRGFLAGRWGRDADGNGVYRGSWMDNRGRVIGFLRGHYGRNDAGEKVFFGKLVARDGQFEAFIKGRWDLQPDCNADQSAFEHAGGWFRGMIYAPDRTPIGVMGGRFRSAEFERGGFFQGRWKLYCPNVADALGDQEEGFRL
jgi:hypothetical protein